MAMSLLNDETTMAEGIDTGKEYHDLLAYQEILSNEQCEVEKLYAKFKESNPILPNTPIQSEESRANACLTALDPSSWNGIKADFYTWQIKFIHIMKEANEFNLPNYVIDETRKAYLVTIKLLSTIAHL